MSENIMDMLADSILAVSIKTFQQFKEVTKLRGKTYTEKQLKQMYDEYIVVMNNAK